MLLALAGVALAGLGQVALLPRQSATPGAWALLAGVLLFGLGVATWARSSPLRWVTPWIDPLARPPLAPLARRTAALLLPAGGAAVGAGVVWATDGFRGPPSTWGALVWLAALAVALVALLLDPQRSARPNRAAGPDAAGAEPRPDGPDRPDWPDHGALPDRLWLGLLAATLGLALALRLVNLAEVPFGVWFDEGESGLEGRRILAGTVYEPVGRVFGRDASVFYYLVAASFGLFGDSLLSLRLVPALLGALAAPAVALLGREWFGWRVGVLAGLFLATSRWELNLSRFGLTSISAVLPAVLAVWLLARAVRRDRLADFGLAGLALGVGMHVYVGWRPILGVAAALLLAGALLRRWRGRAALARVGVYLALAALVALPVLVYAARYPDEYNKRSGQISLFAQKTTLPEQLEALGNNVRVHLLMFNFQGDRNGRHNLSGAPMLDPVSGVLFALGIGWALIRALALLRALAPRGRGSLPGAREAVLLLWGLGSLAGGILTLDFEAPQAVRSVTITPVVALASALGLLLLMDRLALLVQAARPPSARLARLSGRLALAGATLATAWVGLTSVRVYFGEQMPSRASWLEFSPFETIIGREARRLAPQRPTILATQSLVNQPSITYIAPEMRNSVQPFDPVADLPLRRPANLIVVFLDQRDRDLADEVRRQYPDAPVQSYTPPRDDTPAMTQVTLTRAAIDASRGVDARYEAAGIQPVVRREPTIGADWRTTLPPTAFPFTAEWRGRLALPRAGDYTFSIPAGFTLTLDGADLAATAWPDGARLRLARGTHALRLVGQVAEPREVQLRWREPGALAFTPLPPEVLFGSLPGGTGLVGAFFPNDRWEGPPADERVDPLLALYFHLLPLPRPYSAEWRGELEAPVSGTYRIGVEQVSTASIWLDGREVLANDTRNQVRDAPLELTAGRHSLRVRFRDQEGGSHLYLSWRPPGGAEARIPGQYLYPPPPEPQPPLAAAAAAPVPTEAVPPEARPTSAIAPLVEPIGIAAAPDGSLYVVDAKAQRVQKLDPSGSPVLQWGAAGAGPGRFDEPFDAAVDTAGRVYVLDSGRGEVQRFGPDGTYEATLLNGAGLFRPRGLAVGRDGRLFVADTGRNRVVEASPTGQVLRVWDEADGVPLDQPTDVLPDETGGVYVVEPPARRLVRLRADGRVAARRDVGPSNTREAPHLARAASGQVVLTDPEAGTALLLDPATLAPAAELAAPAGGRRPRPVGVAVAPGGVWVADPSGQAVRLGAPAAR